MSPKSTQRKQADLNLSKTEDAETTGVSDIVLLRPGDSEFRVPIRMGKDGCGY